MRKTVIGSIWGLVCLTLPSLAGPAGSQISTSYFRPFPVESAQTVSQQVFQQSEESSVNNLMYRSTGIGQQSYSSFTPSLIPTYPILGVTFSFAVPVLIPRIEVPSTPQRPAVQPDTSGLTLTNQITDTWREGTSAWQPQATVAYQTSVMFQAPVPNQFRFFSDNDVRLTAAPAAPAAPALFAAPSGPAVPQLYASIPQIGFGPSQSGSILLRGVATVSAPSVFQSIQFQPSPPGQLISFDSGIHSPEPGTAALCLIGAALGILAIRRRKSSVQ